MMHTYRLLILFLIIKYLNMACGFFFMVYIKDDLRGENSFLCMLTLHKEIFGVKDLYYLYSLPFSQVHRGTANNLIHLWFSLV